MISKTIKAYYSLTKPGVLYGNAITAAAGFLLASNGKIDFGLFLALFFGSTFVIASACVLNNFLDQDIDKIMSRTKNRALVAGKVAGRDAVIFSILLGISGITILALFVNALVVAIGIVGFIDYVVLYGMLSKRLSWHGTVVGSISGATPILAGYVAISGRMDLGAFLVFLALFFWQMPEFYSISIYRLKEYKAANIPVSSVVKGVDHTKKQIFVYTFAFVATSVALSLYGYAGYTYLVVMSLLGLKWLWLGVKGLNSKNNDKWARSMFHFSLIILLAFSFMISVNAWLP